MNKHLRLLAAAVLLATHPAESRTHAAFFSLRLPAGAPVTPQMAARFNEQIEGLFYHAAGSGAQQKQASGPDKLLALSSYDFTLPPNAQSLDSLRFIYAAPRGSAYDFISLSYDYENRADYPYRSYGSNSTGYVRFDTAYDYTTSGAANASVSIARSYDASDKVILKEDFKSAARTFFVYDVNGRLTRTIKLQDNGTGIYDSASQDIYIYNSGGYVVKDSMLSWNGSSWQPGGAALYTVNAAGYPTQYKSIAGSGPTALTILQIDITYNSGNLPVLMLTKQPGPTPGVLVNYERDTISYSGTQMVYGNNYLWDNIGNIWTLHSSERRRLNAAGLPDSIFVGTAPGGASTHDTVIKRIAYNSNDNPLYLRTYAANAGTLLYEDRYYYSFANSAGVAIVQPDLSLYPNPAHDVLQLKGLLARRYRIINMTGQTLQQESFSAPHSNIATDKLPNGNYVLEIEDWSGVQHMARFMKN
jgi:hypothetical protein